MSTARHSTVFYRPGSRRALRETYRTTEQQLKDLDALRTGAMELAYAIQDRVTGRAFREMPVGGDDLSHAYCRVARTVRQIILLERRLMGLDPPPQHRGPRPDGNPGNDNPASAPGERRETAEPAEALDDGVEDFSDLESLDGLLDDMDDAEVRGIGYADRDEARASFARIASGTSPTPEDEPPPPEDAPVSPPAAPRRETAAELTALIQAKPQIPVKTRPPLTAEEMVPCPPYEDMALPELAEHARRLKAELATIPLTPAFRTRLRRLEGAINRKSGIPPPQWDPVIS